MSSYEIHNILKRARTLEISSPFQPYSGVEILTGLTDDDGNEVIYYAPSDPNVRNSGRVLTIENPWGTQAQADNILTQIKGFTYQPYDATEAFVDPSAEIGDGVSVNDVYSGIYSMSRSFSALMPADVSAPQSEEIDHEYPYESMADRSIERRFTAMESEFRIQSGEIAAKVSETGGAGNNVSWSLKSTGWAVYSNGKKVFEVTSSGASVSGKITASSGEIGGFRIGSSYINLNGLSFGGNKQGIYLGDKGLQLGPQSGSHFKASVNGDVEAANMTLTGQLTIGGTPIAASDLRKGAERANSGYSGWNGVRDNWNNATTYGTNTYPRYFYCGTLNSKDHQIVMGEMVFTPRFVSAIGLWVLGTGGVG